MNRDKQINDMAQVLKDYTKKKNITASYVILEDYAEALYNAGYRKASEVAREIFEEIDKRFEALLKFYPFNGEVQDAKTFVNVHWKHIKHSIMCDYDAELKKKYESEGEG